MTDPTPRTAATAREALLDHLERAAQGQYPLSPRSAYARTLDDLIALASAEAPGAMKWCPLCPWRTADDGLTLTAHQLATHAEAPGRVAALEAALETLADAAENASEHVHERANWSAAALLAGIRIARRTLAAPEAPGRVAALEMFARSDPRVGYTDDMARAGITPEDAVIGAFIRLAAPASPAGVSGEGVGAAAFRDEPCKCPDCPCQRRNQSWQRERCVDCYEGDHTPAPAPTPSEPVERCGTCDRPLLSNAHEWDHDFTPATRDE